MTTLVPGSTLGVLGGGQLGRMCAIEARKMGFRIHVYDPSKGCPASSVADLEVNAPFDDHAALSNFISKVDVLTYEFENIPATALTSLKASIPLRPSPNVLHICQNRRREKEFLSSKNIPVAPFKVVSSLIELESAVKELGYPCVLKTADFGYDGKGQQKIKGGESLESIWKNHQAPVGVLEGWIDFEAELSVIVARRPSGEIKTFPVAGNIHKNHILALTQVPAGFDPMIEHAAIRIAEQIALDLSLEGLLAVECFLTRSGKIIVNELAPRPHNSGHYSFDSCVTSQFEQHVRAVCDLPLGDTRLMSPVIMRNILGDVWAQGTPPWDRLLGLDGLKLHLYGKESARPGRKMGHYCILAESIDKALAIDQEAQRLLKITY